MLHNLREHSKSIKLASKVKLSRSLLQRIIELKRYERKRHKTDSRVEQ